LRTVPPKNCTRYNPIPKPSNKTSSVQFSFLFSTSSGDEKEDPNGARSGQLVILIENIPPRENLQMVPEEAVACELAFFGHAVQV
jgi:hypothetical protein